MFVRFFFFLMEGRQEHRDPSGEETRLMSCSVQW